MRKLSCLVLSCVIAAAFASDSSSSTTIAIPATNSSWVRPFPPPKEHPTVVASYVPPKLSDVQQFGSGYVLKPTTQIGDVIYPEQTEKAFVHRLWGLMSTVSLLDRMQSFAPLEEVTEIVLEIYYVECIEWDLIIQKEITFNGSRYYLKTRDCEGAIRDFCQNDQTRVFKHRLDATTSHEFLEYSSRITDSSLKFIEAAWICRRQQSATAAMLNNALATLTQKVPADVVVAERNERNVNADYTMAIENEYVVMPTSFTFFIIIFTLSFSVTTLILLVMLATNFFNNCKYAQKRVKKLKPSGALLNIV